MHSFSQSPHSAEFKLTNYGVHENDWICFCFGEIDTRAHVHRHVTDTTSYEHVINTLVENYAKAIQVVASEFVSLHVCVFMIPPPYYFGLCTDTVNSGDEFSARGSDSERSLYTVYFNEALRIMCQMHGFNFICAYEDYCCKDGFLNPAVSDGYQHIKLSAPVEAIIATLLK